MSDKTGREWSFDELKRYLLKKLNGNFYGEITLKLFGGKLVLIEEKKTIKSPDEIV